MSGIPNHLVPLVNTLEKMGWGVTELKLEMDISHSCQRLSLGLMELQPLEKANAVLFKESEEATEFTVEDLLCAMEHRVRSELDGFVRGTPVEGGAVSTGSIADMLGRILVALVEDNSLSNNTITTTNLKLNDGQIKELYDAKAAMIWSQDGQDDGGG